MTPRQLQETLAPWMTAREVAHRYSVATKAVYRAASKGTFPQGKKLPAFQGLRWHRDDLDAYDGRKTKEPDYQI